MYLTRTGSPKALVVDDVSQAAETVAYILHLSRGFSVRTVYDPYDALKVVKEENYDLVVIDYQMPGLDGIQLLKQLKNSDAATTYIIMTGRNDMRVIMNALKAGAQGFVSKPFTRNELLESIDLALEKTRLLREHIHMRVYAPLLRSAIGALLSALEYEHDDTANHSKRVGYYAEEISIDFGMSQEERHIIQLGALFHDIGKIGVPDHILLKPGFLTEEERHIMRTHPEIGWRIIKDVEGLGKVAEIVRAHHERFDGKGYPDGLSGQQIPLGARIASVADSFEAIVSPRVYSSGRSVEEALAEVRRCSGTQFDPAAVEIFLNKMENGKISYKPTNTPISNLNLCVQPQPE
ncbi:HD domain-containing phosphohydrolase [Candidatus Chlorohelix sp.]|uniref:response regulator n=1 Tax=Candidatus Chlorohelix sp. TaxID=3139201 RepID=UPI00301EB0CC